MYACPNDLPLHQAFPNLPASFYYQLHADLSTQYWNAAELKVSIFCCCCSEVSESWDTLSAVVVCISETTLPAEGLHFSSQLKLFRRAPFLMKPSHKCGDN